MEDLLIQSTAVYLSLPNPVLFLSMKFQFLELKICPKYLTKILKILTERFFAKTFRD